jgi:hypothetical protein
MDIPSKQVFDVLKDKGVVNLHHANSVATACNFLRRGCLLSRGSVKRLNLFQTSQYSDNIDMKHSLWFDIFMDSVDIHHRARAANSYGPVLFVLDIDRLAEEYIGRLWVTKTNPTKWTIKTREQRWFSSKEELIDKFSYGTFDQMIVARHSGGELSITNSLLKIVLDDPQRHTVPGKVDIYSMAVGALRSAMQDGNMDVPIERRKCRPACSCGDEYDDSRLLFKMFDPMP